ncbi:MAG: FG-GAP-like repeat-containing protein [Kiritimatiellales bacterium]
MNAHASEKFYGWKFSPEEAWECVPSDPKDPGTAVFSVHAGLPLIKTSWIYAGLPLSKTVSGPGAFRFGGWIQIDNGDDYSRNHLATIRLLSDRGCLSELQSYVQDGRWSYFEGRLFIPANAGTFSLQLGAAKRYFKDALISFKGVYIIPDNVEAPVWRADALPNHSAGVWQRADCQFRISGDVSDPKGGQPLWADFDLARLMLKAGCRTPIDPASLQVMAVSPDGKGIEIPSALDHSRGNLSELYLRNSTLKWRTVEGVKRYEIYFNAAGAEGPKPCKSEAPLGVGELLRYPAGLTSPLWVGWPGLDLDVQDVDGDGDLDVYANNTDAGIWLLRNIGSNDNPLFLPRQKPLPSDALPVMPMRDLVIDWDKDGVPDTILGKRTPLGAGRYIDGIAISLKSRLSGTPGGMVDVVTEDGSGVVYSNAAWFSMRSGDFDGDGLADIAVGSAECDLQLLLNRGVQDGKPVVERVIVPWNLYEDPNDSGDMSLKPCAVDWNGDGRDDIVWTGWGGYVHLLINRNLKGKAEFENRGLFLEQSGIVNVIESPMPDAADWDGDGDLDFICGNADGFFMWVENTGTATQPKFAAAKPLADEYGRPFRITSVKAGGTIQGPAEKGWGYTSCTAADLDRDGDFDLIINDALGRLRWIENLGSRTQMKLSRDIRNFIYKDKPLIIPWRNKPTVADWNGDGVLEITVLDERGQLVAYPVDKADPDHLGKRTLFRDFEGRGVAVNAELIKSASSGRTQLCAADWDGDGDIDLMAGRPRNAGEGNLVYYENIGTSTNPLFTSRRSMKARGAQFAEWSSGSGHDQWHSTGPCMADLNGDGTMDLIFGVEMGQLAFYTHDYFEGDSFPVFCAESFQSLEEGNIRTVFNFNGEPNEFTDSLNILNYPPQLLPEDAVKISGERSVKIISPHPGITLSGPVGFEAEATGGRSLRQVDFFVDGEFLAVERVAPYVAFGDNSTWDTSKVKNGEHTLSVTATYSDGEKLTTDQMNRFKN